MNRRSFFTKLFGGSALGAAAVLAPRQYQSFDAVRDLRVVAGSMIPSDYLVQAIRVIDAAKLRQALLNSHESEIQIILDL